MDRLEIRKATKDDFSIAVDWAAREGWNPGIDDLSAFFAADPDGFLIGSANGVPVASISVVRYGDNFGFLGFYIVRPEHRGRGLGLQIWRAGLRYLEGRTIGLDGVVAQQANYRKSGFEMAGRNIRFSGPRRASETSTGTSVQPLAPDVLGDILDYDEAFFPANRRRFLAEWVSPSTPAARTCVVARSAAGSVVGFGVIRQCRSGYKIGPLFADGHSIASDILSALCSTLKQGSMISVDVPADNADGVRLAEDAGLQPAFETARMYRGQPPSLPIERTFGITTFELG